LGMADKPSRELVLYGDGLARFIDPSHNNLHSLVSKASCSFLTLPKPLPLVLPSLSFFHLMWFKLIINHTLQFTMREKKKKKKSLKL